MYYEKYGAVERYFIELASQLKKENSKVIFVYNKSIEPCEYLRDINLVAHYVTLNPNQSLVHLIKKISALILKYKPHIVHTHFNPKIVRLVCYLSFLFGVKKRFNTFHGMSQSKRVVTKIWMYSLNLLNSKQFTISEAIRKEQISIFKTSKQKIVTLRLGLKKSFFKTKLSKQEIRIKYNLPTKGMLIGNVAFHNPIKGVDILIEAMALLKKNTQESIYLCQIGSESENYTSELKEKVKRLGLDDIVIWLGIQNNVPELLRAFDIYVQPSRSEGLGLAILEAFSVKLPVIASDIGGIPEIINNERGFLFEVGNYNELSCKLQELVNSDSMRRAKGELAYQFIGTNYNVTKQAALLIEYYK